MRNWQSATNKQCPACGGVVWQEYVEGYDDGWWSETILRCRSCGTHYQAALEEKAERNQPRDAHAKICELRCPGGHAPHRPEQFFTCYVWIESPGAPSNAFSEMKRRLHTFLFCDDCRAVHMRSGNGWGNEGLVFGGGHVMDFLKQAPDTEEVRAFASGYRDGQYLNDHGASRKWQEMRGFDPAI